MAKVVQFAKLGGPEVIEIVEQGIAPPQPNEVQIAVKAAGLNRAELLFLGSQYLVDPVLPSRLGFEGAGEVVAVGTNANRFKPGDRVAITPAFKQDAYGVLAEIANFPKSALEPIIDGVDYATAAAFWMAFGTAYGMLVQKGGLTKGGGQTIVLNAASSSVGTAALQIVREHGGMAIAITRSQEKVASLKQAGADHVIVSESDNIAGRIMEITGGAGFDIALDAVGGDAGEALANGAGFESMMVVYGLLTGTPSTLPFGPMVANGLCVTGYHLSWSTLDHPDRRRLAVEHLNEGLASGAYKPLIDRAFAFADIREAYEYIASNQQLGKIVMEIGQ